MNRDIVQIINGFKFYIETLDFQGNNKKFYITFHQDSSFKSFDIVINQNWINEVGFEKAMEYVSNVFNDPKKSTKKTLGDLWRVNSKIKYYRNKVLENEKKIIENECKKKIESIDKIEDKIIERFKRLNTMGKANLLEHLDTLLGTNKYIVNN